MSFCYYSKDLETSGKTVIDNLFLSNYLPDADGDAVKVYLYGLYMCQNSAEIDVNAFAAALELGVEEVKNYFKFWDEYGLLTIVATDPFSVAYNPVGSLSAKYRRYKPEKYEKFAKSLQNLFADKMISVSEYSAYFDLLENTPLHEDALLRIAKYCIDIKGGDISYRYVLAVAKDFIARGITTAELAEKELSGYVSNTKEISDIFTQLSVKKRPDVDDLKVYKKWTDKYGFDQELIIFICKNRKIKNFKKLDAVIDELYADRCFTEADVLRHYKLKDAVIDLTYKINKNLGIYVEIVDGEVNAFVTPWLNIGFTEEALLFISEYCFKKNRRTLEDMNETVNNFYKSGLITKEAIVSFMEKRIKGDAFIKKLFENLAVNRKINDWDRDSVATWRDWGFNDEMILEAAKRSVGTAQPIRYVSGILSRWKSDGITSIDTIPADLNGKKSTAKNGGAHFASEREYSKEELNKLIDDIDDIKDLV